MPVWAATLVAVVLTSVSGNALLSDQGGKPAIEKVGETSYRLGAIRIDTATRELMVPGVVNDVMTLEFVANAKDGAKAYESLITLETDAISLNAALLLLGLDPAHARPSKTQFDPDEPKGDPVDIFVSWDKRRVRIEELLFDQRGKKTVQGGPWVYTGSSFIDTSEGRRFMAELDGVLIGLMHGPSALIENPRSDTVKKFGSIALNPNIGVKPGTTLTLTIKALTSPK